MEMDYNKPVCPILDVDGVISGGKQFDLDITLPDVNRKKYYNCFFNNMQNFKLCILFYFNIC